MGGKLRMNYIYTASIFFDTSDVVGVNPTTEATNTTDFETNYKASCLNISELDISDKSVVIEKTYTDFKTLVATPIDWTDVKLKTEGNHYDLYLISAEQL